MLLLALAPAAAAAAAGSSGGRSGTATVRVKGRTVTLDVTIQRFAVRGRRVVAQGVAAANVRTRDGRVRRSVQNVTFAVKQGSQDCRILSLRLAKLHLVLLGLIVDTSEINLKITGDPSQTLGKLFCSLARGLRLDTRALKASAARLNRHLRSRPMRVYRVNARIAPSARAAQAAPSTCQVLTLILGPLNLDLLGLKVDLYGATTTQPVRVDVTADPTGGVLGSLFCQLANQKPAG